MELIFGGMVEPGYVVTPWPRKKDSAMAKEAGR